MAVVYHKFLIALEARVFMVIVQRRKLLPTPIFNFAPQFAAPYAQGTLGFSTLNDNWFFALFLPQH